MSAAKCVLLLDGLDSVGALLAVGHALAAGENVAEAAAILSDHGKLDYLHPVEHIELVYWLRRLDYEGWLTLDIFPYREDGVRAATECREWLEVLLRSADQVPMDAFADVIQRGDATEASRLVRRCLNL